MSVYQKELRLRSSDVDMHRRLRTSVLFGLIQEAAIAHTEQLGMGRDKTLDRGILWVVTLQTAEIRRMPAYDEEIVLRSWPGRTMHVLFPRYCSVGTAAGEPLIRTCTLWSLVDAGTRKLVFPERYGIEIDGVVTGDEIPIPSPPRAIPCDHEREFTVPFSCVDLNGHMNNTRYFDLAEDCIPAVSEGRELRSVNTEFGREIRYGETVRLRWGQNGGSGYFTGENGQSLFRMRFDYADA